MARSLSLAKLYIELEAETKGLENQLTQAEKSLGRTANFVRANPVAALGALGTAAIVAGFELAQMAEKTNKALGLIADRVPGATDAIADLRHEVNATAIAFGVSQDDVIATMDAVSRAGVANAEELVQITRAATAAGVALGKNGAELIGGLDAALDIFGIAARDAGAVLAQFFVVAEGRTSVDDLMDSIEKLAPAIRGTGLDFLTTTQALAAIIDSGFEKGKGAIKEFTRELETGGVPAIQALAAKVPIAEDAVDRLNARISETANDIEHNSERIRAEFRAIALELGTLAQQAVVSSANVAKGLSVWEHLASVVVGPATVGLFKGIRDGGKGAAVGVEEAAGSLERLGTAGGIATGAAGTLTASLIEAKNASGELGSKSTADLRRYQAALEEAAKAGTADKESKAALVKVNKELADRQKEGAKAAEEAAKRHSDAAKQMADRYEAAMKRVRKASIDASKTLTDDLNLAIEELHAELLAAGVSADDAATALTPLLDQLKLVKLEEDLALPEILKRAADNLTAFDLNRLKEAKTRLDALLLSATEGTKQQAEVKKRIEEVTKKIVEGEEAAAVKAQQLVLTSKAFNAELDAALPKVQDIPASIDETKQRLQETVDRIHSVASDALAIATHFGVIDEKSGAVLQNILNIGANLPAAFSGDPSAILGAIGGLAGVISSLFGESPVARAREKLLQDNTEVMAELVRSNGDILRLNQPGAKIAGVGAALTAAVGGKVEADGFNILRELRNLGLTVSDLEAVARDFDLQIRNPETGRFEFRALQQLLQAITDMDVGFATDFQGELDKIRHFIRAGLIDPTQEFGALLNIVRGDRGSPAIARALEGINPFAEGGRDAATAALQQLLKEFEAGTLTAGDLGGLTGQQFLGVLGDLLEFLRGEGDLRPTDLFGPTPQGERPPLELAAETESFYTDSLATAATQAELLAQGLVLEAEQAARLAAIETLLAGLGTGPIAPPPLPASALAALDPAGAVSVLVRIEEGAVRVEGVSDPEAAAHEAVRLMDQKLADRFRDEMKIRGVL